MVNDELVQFIVAVVVGGLIGAGVWQAVEWWRRRRVKPDRKVRIHLTRDDGTDVTIEGFLVGRASGHYILRRVQQIVGPGDEVPLQGDVEVPEARVMFVQVLQA